MTKEDGLLHEMLDVAENIFKDKRVSDDSWNTLRRVILHLYYSDKDHPADWTASADAILRKHGFILTEPEES